jgi:hypothetical protein
MTRRTPRQQTKHDKEVKRTADSYQKRGFKVKADISGYKQPETKEGRRPDMIAQKDGKEIIVEVETRDSIKTDQAQQRAFENYAAKHKNTKFRTKIAK